MPPPPKYTCRHYCELFSICSSIFVTLAMNYASFLSRNVVFLYSARKINFVVILSQDFMEDITGTIAIHYRTGLS